MLFLYLVNLFLFFPSLLSLDKCLKDIQDSNLCLICSSNCYEKQYSDSLKLAMTKKTILLDDECLEKDAEKLKRKILITNDENYVNSNSYDYIYLNIASALEFESKIMAK